MIKDRSHNDECLPCPVCGVGSELLYIDEFKGKFQVVCDVCQSSVRQRLTIPEAINSWNLLMQPVTEYNKDAIKIRKEYQKGL